MGEFQSHNGFARTFMENKLTLGFMFPLGSCAGRVPKVDLKSK
jgi:hypothetical protein